MRGAAEAKSDPLAAERCETALEPLSVVTATYLAAPVALFFLGWLRSPLSWIATAALGVITAAFLTVPTRRCCVAGGSNARTRSRAPRARIALAQAVAGAAALLLVVAVSGAGGFGAKTWDWHKHDAILHDLVEQPWPVAYRIEGSDEEHVLVYYVAYYLPAALAGKVAGWAAANVALFAWTFTGVVLAWRWIVRLGRASPFVALALLVLWGGLDVLGALVTPARAEIAPGPWWRNFHLEWWNGQLVFPGNVTLLAFAPHQALGGWLASALSLDALRRGARGFLLAVPPSLALLWSPFATVGLAALIAILRSIAGRGRRHEETGASHRRTLRAAAVVALPACAVALVLYFAARLVPLELPSDLEGPPEARARAAFVFAPAWFGAARFALEWSRFLALELAAVVAALAAVLWSARRREEDDGGFERRLLVAAAVVLAAVPFVRYGYFNDWVMRVSIPPLFALQIVAARALSNGAASRGTRLVLAAVLAVGALFPLAQLRMQLEQVVGPDDWIRIAEPDAVADLFEQQRELVPPYGFVEQYLGSARAPFFRYLATPLEPRVIASPAGDSEPQPPSSAPSAARTSSN